MTKLSLITITLSLAAAACTSTTPNTAPDASPAPKQYPNQPVFTPPDQRVDSYLDVLPSSLGPAIDPAKGYYQGDLGGGVHWVTDGMYQSMFVVTSTGVVVIDAPQTIGANLTKAIAEVTTLPVTHLIYSHHHADHIGASAVLPDNITVIAQEETAKLLTRAADPNRRVPTVTFTDSYTLVTGGQTIELSYPGNNHEPGNILIYLPAQHVAMLVDIVFPGWMMWKRLALAQDIPGLIPTLDSLLAKDFTTVVTGHVGRLGTRDDVLAQKEFLTDIKAAAGQGLGNVDKAAVGADLLPKDRTNPWAFFRSFIDRAVNDCVNTMAAKWQNRISGFDVWIYDQCSTMEQSIRID